MSGRVRKLCSWRCAAVLAALCGIAGCTTGLGGRTPPSRFYLLAPLAAPTDQGGGPSLGIGPIRLADYLDRPQIVTRSDRFRIELGEFDRWAEPLDAAVSRVLAADLAALLGSDRVRRYPWRDPRNVEVQVEVDVLRFDGPVAGPVELVAHWRVERSDRSVERTAHLVEPLEGQGYEAFAAGMSRALLALSREIAAAVGDQPPAAPGPGASSGRSRVPIRVPSRSGVPDGSGASARARGVATSTRVEPNSKRPHSPPFARGAASA